MSYTPLRINGYSKLGVDISEKIYHEYVEGLLAHMESGDMTREEIHDASSYILDSLSAAGSEDEVLSMLEEIEKRWPKLSQVATNVKGHFTQSADKDKLKIIQDRLVQFSTQ